MITLVTYGSLNTVHYLNRIALENSARKNGVDRIHTIPEIQPKEEFFIENETVMSAQTGAGYWLWKPFIVSKALEQIPDGDIVAYADAGCRLRAHLQPLVRLMSDKDFIFFENDHDCQSYTKRDAFIETDCDAPQYYGTSQLDAAFFLVRKSARSLEFIQRWLEHCRSRAAISDDENLHGKPDLPGFIEHRHDQAILSLLARRDLGSHEVIYLPRSAKYQFIQHHRRRNAVWPIWLWHLFHDAIFEWRRRVQGEPI